MRKCGNCMNYYIFRDVEEENERTEICWRNRAQTSMYHNPTSDCGYAPASREEMEKRNDDWKFMVDKVNE